MNLIKKHVLTRLFARICDYCGLFIVLGGISLFLPLFYNGLFYFLLVIAIPLIWVPLEALLISRWGTTPGKKIFHITVRHSSGRRLSFAEGVKRGVGITPAEGIVESGPLSKGRIFSSIVVVSAALYTACFGSFFTEWSSGIERGVAAEGWVHYESDKGGFSISFPNDPKEESKQLVLPSTGKVLEYEEITTNENKAHYSISHMTIPRKWKLAGNVTLLKYALDGIVKHSPNTELIDKRFITHQGHRALDFELKEEGKTTRGRLIVVGSTMYKITVVCQAKALSKAGAEPFLNSFSPPSD